MLESCPFTGVSLPCSVARLSTDAEDEQAANKRVLNYEEKTTRSFAYTMMCTAYINTYVGADHVIGKHKRVRTGRRVVDADAVRALVSEAVHVNLRLAATSGEAWSAAAAA